MKSIKKIAFLLVLFAVVLFPGRSAEAAKVPGKVTKLTASVQSETAVKLSWNKVSGATKYVIYKVDPSTGKKLSKVATTAKTSYKVSKLKPDTRYAFTVYAANSAGTSKNASNTVTVSTKISAPGQVKGFKVSSYGDKSVTLKWNKTTDANGYAVYQYNANSKNYKLIGTSQKTSYTVSNLKAGSSYKFTVRAYRKVNGVTKYGKSSKSVTAYPVKGDPVSGRKFTATLKTNVNVKIISSGQKLSLKKGQKVYAPKKSSGTVTAQLADGRRFKIKAGNLKYTSNLYTVNKTYSKSTAENYINSKGYSSSTGYLIWINQYTTTVTIFKGSKGKWKQVRSCLCVVGRNGKTPVGTYRICKRDSAYGGPRLYFTWNGHKGNSFHRYITSLHRGSQSLGCVRMGNSDLDYLANHCSMGTTVVSN